MDGIGAAEAKASKVVYQPDDFANLDREINKCLVNSSGPAGMKECLVNGMSAWDKELNKSYTALMNDLKDSPSAKSALQKSEREWIKFRDLEFKLIDRQYRNAAPETDPAVDVLANKLDVVETRARELQNIKDNNIAHTTMTNSLDRKLSACLQESKNPNEQNICIGNGIEDWKSELSKQQALLPARFRPAMRPAQTQWLRFQEAEHRFLAERFPNDTSPQELSAYMNLLRDRAIQLSMRNSVRFK